MLQVVKMTDEEKFKMYMEVPHEELVRMKIEEERLMEIMENERPQYYSTQPLFTLTAEEVENLKDPIQYFANKLNKGWLMEAGGAYLPPYSWEKAINNLLTRIKQWQDENRTNKRTKPASD